MSKPVVFIGMPHFGPVCFSAARGLLVGPTAGKFDYMYHAVSMSLLTAAFNHLWITALNKRQSDRVSHFAMIHADVEPVEGWCDVLMAELQRLDADLVSAVIPLKTMTGLTSTAVDEIDGVRRLTMREIMRLPETFGSADVGGRPLLVNTGLFVCDLAKPWAEEMCFHIHDRVYRGPDGRWQMEVVPEDWNFSRFLNGRGCRLYATRKVALKHHGNYAWSNQGEWGDWDHDQDYHRK